MYSSYVNYFDPDTFNLQEMVECDMREMDFNFNDPLLQGEHILSPQDSRLAKQDRYREHPTSSPGDLTNLQWLQNVSIPMEKGNKNQENEMMVDPNTAMPVQWTMNQISSVTARSVPITPVTSSLPMAQPVPARVPDSKPKIQGSKSASKENTRPDDKAYPKPLFSYSCLIAMALKNSETGTLPVSEIYKFMMHKFPYFLTAPDGWKPCENQDEQLRKFKSRSVKTRDSVKGFHLLENSDTLLRFSPGYMYEGTKNMFYLKMARYKNSVRHNLSLNKAFCKLERPQGASQRKGCLWSLKPEKRAQMDKEIRKWKKKHSEAIRASMAHPEELNISSEDLEDASPQHHLFGPTDIVVDDKAAADAAKELFGNNLIQEIQNEELDWDEIMASSTDLHLDPTLTTTMTTTTMPIQNGTTTTTVEIDTAAQYYNGERHEFDTTSSYAPHYFQQQQQHLSVPGF